MHSELEIQIQKLARQSLALGLSATPVFILFALCFAAVMSGSSIFSWLQDVQRTQLLLWITGVLAGIEIVVQFWLSLRMKKLKAQLRASI